MVRFDYHRPASISEVLRVLEESDGQGVVLAGGTDLLVEIKQGRRAPSLIISLGRIRELQEIRREADGSLRIGATATLSEIAKSPQVRGFHPAISEAVSTVGSTQVRNRGTLGGNLCNASPSADAAPVLLALDAQAQIQGSGGSRVVPLSEFFAGPRKTVLQRGEILTDVWVPAESASLKCTYLKLGVRKAMEIAIAGVAVALRIAEDRCEVARVALGAVAPTPVRSTRAEDCLMGSRVETVIKEAARAARDDCQPITDIRASADYRRDMVSVLVKRAITQLIG
jgi:CO/xanthine dehydrogenase FAD-binding subunit